MEILAASDLAARLAVLRARWWGWADDPAADPELVAWADGLIQGNGVPVGIAIDEVDPGWIEPLALAGVPLASQGQVSWRRSVRIAEIAAPVLHDDLLELPPLGRFTTLTSLPLKPLRQWVQRQLGLRLQAGVGVQVFLRERRLVMLNCAGIPRHGFAYGPPAGMRTVLQLEPGRWSDVGW